MVNATEDVTTQESEDEQPKTKMGMPIELYEMVATEADAAGDSLQSFIRKTLAQRVGYDGPLTLRRGRVTTSNMSDEEKKIARKAVADSRRKLFAALLAKYEQNPEVFGDLGLDNGNSQ